jgi:hypothetical protein
MGYGLDGRVRSSAEETFFYPQRRDRFCVPPSLLYNGTGGSFPGCNAAGARS